MNYINRALDSQNQSMFHVNALSGTSVHLELNCLPYTMTKILGLEAFCNYTTQPQQGNNILRPITYVQGGSSGTGFTGVRLKMFTRT